MDRFINRRLFLKLSGMSLALSLTDPLSASLRGAQRTNRLRRLSRDARSGNAQTDTPTLLLVFLRGGCDGLNVSIPTESGEYTTYSSQEFRGRNLAVGMSEMANAPQSTLLTDSGGADLGWGLHPRMYELMDLWNQGSLIMIPDAHYAEASRSHFDSQQFMESGTPWNKLTPDGWANRWLSQTAQSDDALRAIAFENQTPFSLQGSYPTLTFSDLNDLSVCGSTCSRNEPFLAAQETAYPIVRDGAVDYDREVGQAGSDLVGAIRAIQAEEPLPTSDPNAPYPDGNYVNGRYSYFGNRLKDLAKLIKTNAFNIEMASVDLHGWDTHNLQLSAYHNHPNLVQALAKGLRGFYEDLGDPFNQNVVTVVLSEFGRTARENGSAGTDHGSASTSFIMGHPSVINGRRVVHGPTGWAGLDDLRDNRDLKHSIDFRDIIADVLQSHMGYYNPDIFPGWAPTPAGLFV